MKNKLFLSAALVLPVLAGCGSSSSEQGWKTDDLNYIPLFTSDGAVVFADTEKGGTTGSYDYATLYHEGVSIVPNAQEGTEYYIDGKGSRLFQKEFYELSIFDDGVAWAIEDVGKPLAAIDRSGNVLFEFKEAEEAYAFHGGLSVFCEANGFWGAVDKKGNMVVSPTWADAGPMFINGLLPVQHPDTYAWGIIDAKGKIVVECRYDRICGYEDEYFMQNYIQSLSAGLIPVKSGEKWGVIDLSGKTVISPQFDYIIRDGKNWLFRKGSSWGWCDAKGKYIINPQFRSALPFGDSGYAAVENDDRQWGYIDSKGNFKIEPQFDEAMSFNASGVAPACDKDSYDWGRVDKSGKWVVNPQFSAIYNKGLNGRFMVEDNPGSFGIVDKTGEYVVNPLFDSAPQALLDNIGGVRNECSIESGYVDVEGIACLVESTLLSLKASTAGELMAAYELSESAFPKSSGTVTLSNNKDRKDVTLKLTGTGINAWSKSSDGWFGYNYSFRKDAPVRSYVLTVNLNDRAEGFESEVLDAVMSKYDHDAESANISLPDATAKVSIAKSRSIVFNVSAN